MTRHEFKTIRHTLALSAQGLARLLRVSDGRTVRRWEDGSRDIPGPAVVIMWLLRHKIITVKKLERLCRWIDEH